VARHPLTTQGPFVVRPLPRHREVVLDRLMGASRRFPVHALVEFDVAEAHSRLTASDPPITWTAFVIATLGRAVALHPEVNARRAGNRTVCFNRVDIGSTVERQVDGQEALAVVAIRDADRKSCETITAELWRAKHQPHEEPAPNPLLTGLASLPGPVRRSAIRLAGRRPATAAAFGPAVGVTSLGMFSRGGGWAIPIPPLTLIATVSSVVERPVAREGHVVIRPMLPLTLSFDHGVIDGAPAARFVETLRDLMESAAVLAVERTSVPDRQRSQS